MFNSLGSKCFLRIDIAAIEKEKKYELMGEVIKPNNIGHKKN
jgi:hypothetical protein